MGLFSRRKPLGAAETQLLNEYTAIFAATGLRQKNATAAAKALLDQAKTEVAQSGADSLPANMGDRLLREEKSRPEVAASFATARRDGATDADIRWWWNQTPLERAMLQKMDEFNRMTMFAALKRDGVPGADAARKIWQAQPKFGNPNDGTGDDRPLPIELKRRIVTFIERYADKPGEMRALVERSSSFNAIVRAAIRNGGL